VSRQPFLSAFSIGVTASLSEEAIFRLFGITWSAKVFRNVALGVLFTSIAWGFGHTQYAIFPVWFRGLEVSAIGLLYGFIFLRYGILPLIAAHYLFDVFWGVAPYILGRSTAYLFTGSLFLLALPLVLGGFAFFRNRDEKEREHEALLDESQKFNLSVLACYIRDRERQGASREAIRDELLRNHWDVTVVEEALSDTGDKK
jgi:hypothetical protein